MFSGSRVKPFEHEPRPLPAPREPPFFRSLAFRLSLWYAGIFALSTVLTFAIVYTVIVSIVTERSEDDLEGDLEELAAFYALAGVERLKSEIAVELRGEDIEQVLFRLWTPEGEAALDGAPARWAALPVPEQQGTVDEPVMDVVVLPDAEHAFRVAQAVIAPGVSVLVGQSLEEDDELVAAIRTGVLVAIVAVILLGVPIGWFLARRALSGVHEVASTAEAIARGNFDRRVPVHGRGDEVDRLAETFNGMLDRIQALVVGMREMTDNLAHDLRSPLTRIRAAAEAAIDTDDVATERASLAISTTEECDRLLEMINITLDIAESESGAARLELRDVDLVQIARQACELFETVAEDRAIDVCAELPERCVVRADLPRLQRAIANIVDNALKHTPRGGQVTLSLLEGERCVGLVVKDTGSGMSDEEIAHIFERFYRCDRSRSHRGNGLGLSLARAFVRSLGGDISVTSAPERGSTFTISLDRSFRLAA